MFCPECDGEFREGIRVCPDCAVALVKADPRSSPEEETHYRPPSDLGPEAGRSVVVLRTGQLWEADLAASSLESAGIPFFRRNETSGGLTFAMPIAPSVAAGSWWTIVVPAPAAEAAAAVLDELPISHDLSPGVIDFAPHGPVRDFWRSYSWFLLGLVALSLFAVLFW